MGSYRTEGRQDEVLHIPTGRSVLSRNATYTQSPIVKSEFSCYGCRHLPSWLDIARLKTKTQKIFTAKATEFHKRRPIFLYAAVRWHSGAQLFILSGDDPRNCSIPARKSCARLPAFSSSSGYDATSMNDVAAALKLSKGGLYHHFQSKDEILFEI